MKSNEELAFLQETVRAIKLPGKRELVSEKYSDSNLITTGFNDCLEGCEQAIKPAKELVKEKG